jgi:hypothetical protein
VLRQHRGRVEFWVAITSSKQAHQIDLIAETSTQHSARDGLTLANPKRGTAVQTYSLIGLRLSAASGAHTHRWLDFDMYVLEHCSYDCVLLEYYIQFIKHQAMGQISVRLSCAPTPSAVLSRTAKSRAPACKVAEPLEWSIPSVRERRNDQLNMFRVCMSATYFWSLVVLDDAAKRALSGTERSV